MNINTQLSSFASFFIYGLILYAIYFLLQKSSLNVRMCYLILPLSTIIFMAVLYKINFGVVHPYFIITMLLGVLCSKVIVNKLKNVFKLLKKIINK